ncbi:dihydropteroate synthase [Terracidiphilus gabretensis]|uniref:dihydropteroate synthase n=1 Tax=Terracidiphilus gabretensis TaxID=1577687 RepID=UPI00071BC408|nr:dihydropteroate synthase [Terracidiphilus gabretensis]
MSPLRPITEWHLRTRHLSLGSRTLICGVVNITPDSFSDGNLFLVPDKAISHALQLIDEGADILDLGAESTRPESKAGTTAALTTEEEQSRLLPVLEGILKVRPDAIISIDTYKAPTARAALLAGAEIINDVSGFIWDPAMPACCAKAQCGVILMHTRGLPHEWRTQPQLPPDDLLQLVRNGLTESLAIAHAAGIPPEAIVLDPGYGFGKRLNENFSLLAQQSLLLELNRPLLVGLSRKSFLGHTLAPLYAGTPGSPKQRETATIAAHTAAILHGASIIRTHSVRPAIEAALIADAIIAATKNRLDG